MDSAGWLTHSIELSVDAAVLDGQILQFGFSNRATDNNDSALLVDNVSFVRIGDAAGSTGIGYSQNFEGLNAADPGALDGEGFQVFNTTLNGDTFAYTYGPFSAPNGGQGFSAIATGEGDVDQGTQYLNIYSDYGNADHSNAAFRHTTAVFQEYTIAVDDFGTYTLSFDAKAPAMTGIDTTQVTALVFIKTLDPSANFATTNLITLDMTNVSAADWASFSLELIVDNPLLEGQILQFGFETTGGNFADSGVFYDNIDFNKASE